MKEPIMPSDMRKGDLIRAEAQPGYTLSEGLTASEWRATGGEANETFGCVSLYLIERLPALPDRATLGWATNSAGEYRLGWWDGECVRDIRAERFDLRAQHVTSFTPATAVPTEALETLRGWRPGTVPAIHVPRDFLAAVDEAQR